jgi:hypothetical protein
MLGDPNFAAFYTYRSGGALPPLSEDPRIWPPPLTVRYHRKSTKIGGTGPWSGDTQMVVGPNFAAFYASRFGGALPPLSEGPQIWAPPLTGRYHRERTKIGGTGPWSGDAQMVGGPNFAAFYASRSGGALPPLSEGPQIWTPPLTGRYRRESTKIGGTGPWIGDVQMVGGPIFAAFQFLPLSTQIYPVECCLSERKPHGFDRLRLRAGITVKARKSGAPAHGAETPKCWAAQISPLSTQIYPAERCLSERKAHGFGLLRLRVGIAVKARKSGAPVPFERGRRQKNKHNANWSWKTP